MVQLAGTNAEPGKGGIRPLFPGARAGAGKDQARTTQGMNKSSGQAELAPLRRPHPLAAPLQPCRLSCFPDGAVHCSRARTLSAPGSS